VIGSDCLCFSSVLLENIDSTYNNFNLPNYKIRILTNKTSLSTIQKPYVRKIQEFTVQMGLLVKRYLVVDVDKIPLL